MSFPGWLSLKQTAAKINSLSKVSELFIPKSKNHCAEQEKIRNGVVPFERFAEREIRENAENDERDTFLQNL